MSPKSAYALTGAIEDVIRKRGLRAQNMWRMATAKGAVVAPDKALENLRHLLNFFNPDARAEAQEMVKDIEKILEAKG